MKLQPATLLLGLAALVTAVPPAAAFTRDGVGEKVRPLPAPMRIAQAPETSGSPPAATPNTDANSFGATDQSATPPAVAPLPSMAAPSTPPPDTRPARSSTPALPPPSTTATRNGAVPLPGAAQPQPLPQGSATLGTGTPAMGIPQSTVQPIYGSPMRDSGAGNGGVPIYNNTYNGTPSTLGGPINGTATADPSLTPGLATAPGQGRSAVRGATQDNPNGYTRQPLGGMPVTRDQVGTFGGRGGYNAQGIYNGTAAQGGSGYGYGSPYAPSGRPTGGLLSTNVDATGPLRPYIPLNTGTVGRPNSGYGNPNGSRPSHIDGRGIQRMD